MPKHYLNIQGYFNFEDIYQFISKRFPEGKFVEIGTWLGKSTCFLAECIKENGGKANLYAIDTFVGEIGAKEQQELVAKSGGSIYELFIENMKKAEVLDLITPIISSSTEASATFEDNSLDFLFIDASHIEADVLDDLSCWFPKIKLGGYIGGHDYYDDPLKCKHSEVKAAVIKFFGAELPQIGSSFLIQKN